MKRFITILFATAVILGSVGIDGATLLTYEYNNKLSGDFGGRKLLVTATINDQGSQGSVLLTVDATNLQTAEYVSALYFNIDPSLDPTKWKLSNVSGPKSIKKIETDGYTVTGSGNYNSIFEFDNKNKKLGAGATLVYEITGDSLIAESFYNSASNKSAVSIKGSGGELDGIGTGLPVPEPATMVLLGLGLIGLAGFGRKKFLKKKVKSQSLQARRLRSSVTHVTVYPVSKG
jgi:hypothetical protein